MVKIILTIKLLCALIIIPHFRKIKKPGYPSTIILPAVADPELASRTSTLLPNSAARIAHDKPAGPPPTQMRSQIFELNYHNSDNSLLQTCKQIKMLIWK